MKGSKLAEIRKDLGLTQEAFATLLGTSQKQISNLENRNEPIPVLMEETISMGLKHAAIDPEFSLPANVHEYFYNRCLAIKGDHAKSLTVTCWICPSPDYEGFGNALIELKFEGLSTSVGGLLLDVLGNTNGPSGTHSPVSLGWTEEALRGFPSNFTPRKEIENSTAKCEKAYKNESGLSYIIRDADGFTTTTVNLSSSGGYKLNALDTIGFPVYPDFVLDRICFELNLINLTCFPDAPVFTPFLIRRVSERAAPVRLGSIKKSARTIEKKDGLERFSFGPLLRPLAGYIYSLSWYNLIPTKAPQ